MVRRLYLIRHAKSSWKNPDTPDFDRPLNKHGKQDAPFMGARLRHFQVKPELIMTSPAKRALKTAKLIAKEIDYPKKDIVEKKKIYGADVYVLLSIIHHLNDEYNDVFLIGHNPGLTNLAGILSAIQLDNIPTCGIFCVEFNIKHWPEVKAGRGGFVFMDSPKKHVHE